MGNEPSKGGHQHGPEYETSIDANEGADETTPMKFRQSYSTETTQSCEESRPEAGFVPPNDDARQRSLKASPREPNPTATKTQSTSSSSNSSRADLIHNFLLTTCGAPGRNAWQCVGDSDFEEKTMPGVPGGAGLVHMVPSSSVLNTEDPPLPSSSDSFDLEGPIRECGPESLPMGAAPAPVAALGWRGAQLQRDGSAGGTPLPPLAPPPSGGRTTLRQQHPPQVPVPNPFSSVSSQNGKIMKRPAAAANPLAQALGKPNDLHRIATAGNWDRLRTRLTTSGSVPPRQQSGSGSVCGDATAAGNVPSPTPPVSVLACSPDEKGRTPLMVACMHGSKFPADVARLLVVANGRAASKPAPHLHQGHTGNIGNGGCGGREHYCLHVAAASGCSLETLSVLHSAFPDAAGMEDGNGNMPLHLAVNNGKYRSVAGELASDPGDDSMECPNENDDDGTIISKAIDNNSFVTIETGDYSPPGISGNGRGPGRDSCPGTPRRRFSLTNSNHDHDSSLNLTNVSHVSVDTSGLDITGSFGAVSRRDTSLVSVCDLLINAHPLALRHRNKRGETPLLLAIYRRSPSDVVSYLIARGGGESVSVPDDFGSYPLHFADRAPSADVVAAMASLHPLATLERNRLGDTPLYNAMSDDCPVDTLCAILENCPEPRKAADSKNRNEVNALTYGWTELTSKRLVAAEDEDREDARVRNNATIIREAQCPDDLARTDVGVFWDKAILLLQAAYHNSVTIDDEGLIVGRDGRKKVWRPVHAAAGSDCPPEFVRFVLWINPSATGDADEDGNTPLHVGASLPRTVGVETMRLLFDSHPLSALARDNNGNTPLHVACLRTRTPLEALQLLLSAEPEAALVRNEAGQTPLFIAIAVGSSIDALRILLQTKPEAVHIRDDQGSSPIGLAWNMLLLGKDYEGRIDESSMRTAVQQRNAKLAEDDAAALGTASTSTRAAAAREEQRRGRANRLALALARKSSSLTGDVRSWMAKIDLLLRASFHGTVSDPLPRRVQWRAVHAACAGGAVPPDVLSFALQILPGEVEVRNERGDLPVHVCARASPYEANRLPQLGSGRCLEMVLKLYPRGACRVDRKGSLPLHIALRCEKAWRSGVQSLVKAFPESVRMREPMSMMFPFMIAAVGNEASNEQRRMRGVRGMERFAVENDAVSETRGKAETATVDTIYNLLQSAPELLQTKSGNAQTHFLWRSHAELQFQTKSLKKQLATVEGELQKRMMSVEQESIAEEKKRVEVKNKDEECRARMNGLERTSGDFQMAMDAVEAVIGRQRLGRGKGDVAS